MTQLKTVWTDNYKVHWRDVRITNTAGIDSLCNFLQESAWRHATHLGVGYEKMNQSNHIWVLVRMLIEMEEYPKWDEEIQISTWPAGLDGLLAFRGFKITGSDGRPLGEASQVWMIIDKVTRRPQKFEGISIPEANNGITRLKIDHAARIILPSKLEKRHLQSVQYTDIDSYGHTTNARYAAMIMNTFDTQWHEAHHLKTFEINFMHESRFADELQMKASNPDNGSYFLTAERQSDKKAIVNARLEWIKH